MSKQLAVRQEVVTVRQTLDQMKDQFSMALPRHLTADRLVRVAMSAIQKTPKLLECDRTSLLSAIMTCAQLGLEPDGTLGQAYLIPFAGKVQFIAGYKGLITLARNSGDVSSIMAQAVHQNDHFKHQFGIHDVLEHIPAEGDRGEITHFYAIAKFKDGGHHWDVMTKADVVAIRDNSQGYKSAKKYQKDGVINSPWEDHFAEMGKKTVIRRIAKYLPMDVQKAAYISDSYDTGRHAHLDRYGEIHIDDPAQIEDQSGEDETVPTNSLDEFAKEDAEPAEKQAEETEHDPENGEVAEEAQEAATDSGDMFPGDTPTQGQGTRAKETSEYYLAGADAFIDGLAKDPPQDYSPSQKAEFTAGYMSAESAESEA